MAYPITYFYLLAFLAGVVLNTLIAVSLPSSRQTRLFVVNIILVSLWAFEDLISNLATTADQLKLISWVLAPTWALLPFFLLITVLNYTGHPRWLARPRAYVLLSLPPLGVLALVFSGKLYTGYFPAAQNGLFFQSTVSMWQIGVDLYIAIYVISAAFVALFAARRESNQSLWRTGKVLGLSLAPAAGIALLSNTLLTPLGVMLPFLGAEVVGFSSWVIGLGMLRQDYFAPIYAATVSRDQARADLSLREQILATMPIGVALLALQKSPSEGYVLRFANPLFWRLSGCQSDLSSWPAALSQMLPAPTELSATDAPTTKIQELNLGPEDPGPLPLMVQTSHVVDDEDLVLMSLQDLSLVKAAERALRQHLGQMFEAQKLEAIGRLSAGIAHDFNNQLTTIIGIASSVDFSVSQDLKNEVQQILRAADRARSLVWQLQMDPDELPDKQALIDLAVSLEKTRGVLQRSLEPQCRLDLRKPNSPMFVRFNPLHLEQVLMTLTTNAKAAMPDGGTLHLEVEADEQKIKLLVRDEGRGMSPEILKRVFEPLYSTKGEAGTGLGLTMTQRLLAKADATITASSVPQQGSTFTILFQRYPADPQEAASPRPEQDLSQLPQTQRSSSAFSWLRVMLVDDDKEVRASVHRILSLHGAKVNEASSGREVLAQVWKAPLPFDLLLTDVDMPTVSGIELAFAMRGLDSQLPVLFMSGFQEAPRELEDARALFIAKPFLPDELFARIRQLFSAKTIAAPSARQPQTGGSR